MYVAHYIADFVHRLGVRNVFMLSGTGSIHLDDAFSQHHTIRSICARHEAAAVFMAEASAKVTDNIGVVVVTTGPGGVNAIGGVAEAWVDAVPVLVISGQVEKRFVGSDARSFGTQGFNVIDPVRGMTKYTALVDDPMTIRYHLERAVHEATTGRPGPVWLDIPLDVQSAEIDPETLEGFAPTTPNEAPGAADAVEQIREALYTADRPLVVIGQGVRQAGAVGELRQLVELLNVPVVASRLGQDILPMGFPLYLGQGGVRGRPGAAFAMREADLVLSLGSSLAQSFVGDDFEGIASDARVVMVDIDRAELRRHEDRLDLAVPHDVRSIIRALLRTLDEDRLPNHDAWTCRCLETKHLLATVRPEHRVNPINSYYFFDRLEAHTDRHHRFVTDTGGSYYVAGQALRFDRGQRELTSGAFANMGIALPLAVGASVSEPTAQVLAIIGDGSIELHIQELRTISWYHLDVKVFVINNGGYASIRDVQDAYCEGRYTDCEEVLDFAKVADAFGLPFERIERHQDLDTMIPKVLADTGPMLIEVMCDPNQEIIGAAKSA